MLAVAFCESHTICAFQAIFSVILGFAMPHIAPVSFYYVIFFTIATIVDFLPHAWCGGVTEESPCYKSPALLEGLNIFLSVTLPLLALGQFLSFFAAVFPGFMDVMARANQKEDIMIQVCGPILVTFLCNFVALSFLPFLARLKNILIWLVLVNLAIVGAAVAICIVLPFDSTIPAP